MFDNHRQDYVIQSNDPKGDEGFGKVLGFVICFVLFLGALQVAYDAVAGWYDAAVNWGSETAAYVASFWPF
ncbi:hypothetical protein [Mesorhizobium sp.]|uniref:hypothetical protein n=1 Tax=Mesorhizobium sp. TaxID=1871066 RepID=UPI000FE574C5|nr:hypothetical protein [Mesorhizobium sp.]RWI62653.1 MAG: hypothetical protein EOR18_32560 [Mesorhizobium sp.]TJV94736.1 MAG: hypothetical protein E5X52_27550 [Mesorhizobium sp.]